MQITHLTKENFVEKIAQGICLVDFWAAWCSPCLMLAPTIEELAEKYDGEVSVCKIDIDEEPELSMQFGVMSIPTVIVFRDGQPISKVVGVQPIEVLEEMIASTAVR